MCSSASIHILMLITTTSISGDLLAFSHRVLHWGGEASAGEEPRVALSYSFADGAFECSAFDSARHLTSEGLPPIGLRLGYLV